MATEKLEAKFKELEEKNTLQFNLFKKDLKEIHNTLNKNDKGIREMEQNFENYLKEKGLDSYGEKIERIEK